MKLIIVSGLSGSGKSIALHTFEDCGYYCIDNLPITLLPGFVSKIMLQDDKLYNKTAIGIDARNQNEYLAAFGENMEFIRSKGIDCKVFYMQADDETLLKRYSETRRRHHSAIRALKKRASKMPFSAFITCVWLFFLYA